MNRAGHIKRGRKVKDVHVCITMILFVFPNVSLQIFALTKQNEIKHDDLCLDASANSHYKDVVMIKCHGKHGNQEWLYKEDVSCLLPETDEQKNV